MKKKLTILLTGPVPPPAGGISIHIQRLSHLLEDEFTIDWIDESRQKKAGIYNMHSMNPIRYFGKISKADILFIHSGNKLFKKIHIIAGKLCCKKVIITLHGYGNRRKQPFRFIDSMIFRMADKIILVNEGIKNKVPLPEQKCIVKHAFLPPVMKHEPALPASILSFTVKEKAVGRVLICANASRLDMHNNQDLYGLDMTIEVAKNLLAKSLPVSFVFTVSSLESGADVFNKGLSKIKEYGITDHFLLISEKLSFVRLIENADIVIRPTNTDGDALTVREAIYFGKTTIASDVVSRPEGTVLFKTRNNEDLEQKLETEINRVLSANHPLGNAVTPQEDYKSFYSGLMNSVAE